MRNDIYPCYKNIFELHDYILNSFTTCKIDFNNNFYKLVLDCVKSNAVGMFKYLNITKYKEEINVLCMEIIRNDKSEQFYQYEEKKGHTFSNLYVFLVPEIDYIESNCSLLQHTLYLYQGIREYDIENQTYKFDFYNRLLKEKIK